MGFFIQSWFLSEVLLVQDVEGLSRLAPDTAYIILIGILGDNGFVPNEDMYFLQATIVPEDTVRPYTNHLGFLFTISHQPSTNMWV